MSASIEYLRNPFTGKWDMECSSDANGGITYRVPMGDGRVSVLPGHVFGGLGLAMVEATSNRTMEVNHAYKANKTGGRLLLALPTVRALGDVVKVYGYSVAGWRVTQRAGEQVVFAGGENKTTAGAAGGVESAQQFDTLRLVCADTEGIWFGEGNGGNFF